MCLYFAFSKCCLLGPQAGRGERKDPTFQKTRFQAWSPESKLDNVRTRNVSECFPCARPCSNTEAPSNNTKKEARPDQLTVTDAGKSNAEEDGFAFCNPAHLLADKDFLFWREPDWNLVPSLERERGTKACEQARGGPSLRSYTLCRTSGSDYACHARTAASNTAAPGCPRLAS